MSLSIRLLGRPVLGGADGGRTIAGQKPWALLTYLLLRPEGATRRELAELLWPEAEDPLAAARWAILQVRRALEPTATLAEANGRLIVRAGSGGSEIRVDAVSLLDGRFEPTLVDELVGGDLLEGMTFADAPEFENWLALQRARLSSAAGAALRWAALLAVRSEPSRALHLVDRALAFDPYDDAAHELGIRIEAERGARASAAARLAGAERRYRTELGVEPPATLRRPLERTAARAGTVSPDAAAQAQLDSARARLDVGDYDAAIDTARRAVSAAAASGDQALEAEALAVLAGVLIHSVRGRDHEAVGLLDRALELAVRQGRERLAAEIERELGYVAFLDAHYGAAESILRRAAARATAAGDPAGAARALTILGACQSDRADYLAAEGTLTDAVERLRDLDDRWEPYAASFLARVRLRTGREAEARPVADRAVDRSRELGWLALLPWPMVVAGEARLGAGELDAASRRFDAAYALACEIGDPCWQAFALRGLGLTAARTGDPVGAVRLLLAAAETAASLPDVYAWCEALILTDLVELEGGREPDHVALALSIARQGPMPDLVARLSSVAMAGQTPRQTRRR